MKQLSTSDSETKSINLYRKAKKFICVYYEFSRRKTADENHLTLHIYVPYLK